MQRIVITQQPLIQGAKILEAGQGEATVLFPKESGGFDMPQIAGAKERYLVFDLEVLEDHSNTMDLFVWTADAKEGDPFTFNLRFGVLPRVKAKICVDLTWLDARVLFPERNPGQLKVVCHGGRVDADNIGKVTFVNYPSFHDVKIRVSDMILTDEEPKEYPLPDVKLIDELGQWKGKDWPGKVKDLEDLKKRLNDVIANVPDAYPYPDWDKWGGWLGKKLAEGTGFFTSKKENGRWWLVDPDGYAFISTGPDCTGPSCDARIDLVEKFMDWLPDRNDPAYASMYSAREMPDDSERRWKPVHFSFIQANLYRVFGENWWDKWVQVVVRQLKSHGINTLANWSDPRLQSQAGMPYVTSLPHFPETELKIFRDFPDVLSPEYAENAQISAQELAARKDDPYMIGYFLRNEPSWAFVDNLCIADEVMYNPAQSVCRAKLIETLQAQYGTIQALNAAWGRDFASFDDLKKPYSKVSSWSDAAREDMRAFSRRMLDAYVSIPSKACRAVDPNHMILGMRWAWISDPDLTTGWQNFDAFSINCYAIDPTRSIQNVENLGVDLPVMIGEFHFGSLESGLPATGLEGVATQKDRGIAYRCYVENMAKHPYGTGCHYFQFYDQFALGRFDGENYNIGLFDVCTQPYEDMMAAIYECGKHIYRVADGQEEPYAEKPVSIPMIAY